MTNALQNLQTFHFVVICTQMSSQTLSFYTFLSIENSIHFMKLDPEVNIFYLDRHFYNSQETANIAGGC